MSSRQIIDLRGGKGKSEPSRHVPLSPRKKTTLRAKRQRVRILLGVCALLFCAGAVYGLHTVSYARQFAIDTISVDGAKVIQPLEIQNVIETSLASSSGAFFSARNIFFYPRASLEHAVATDFPRVRTVKISRPSLLATAIVVDIAERTPFARWCQPPEADSEVSTCYLIDDTGFIFANDATSLPTEAYFFSGGVASTSPIGQQYLPEHFAEVVALLKTLSVVGFNPLEAHDANDQDYVVRLSEGFSIKISFGSDANGLVKNLQLVLSSDTLRKKKSEIEYVDLRFGNRVYYKLKGQAQTEGTN